MRKLRKLFSLSINGWFVEKCPNTFASEHSYIVTGLSSDGYPICKYGFSSKKKAVLFANSTDVPVFERCVNDAANEMRIQNSAIVKKYFS